MTDYSYTGTKQADGKFAATLAADGTTIDTAMNLRNERAARAWAEAAAITHKRNSVAPPAHGEEHIVFGSFEL